VRFVATTLCVAYQRVFIVVVYFVVDSVRKLLDNPRTTCSIFPRMFCDTRVWLCVLSIGASQHAFLWFKQLQKIAVNSKTR
jgi:hypothetical protein